VRTIKTPYIYRKIFSWIKTENMNIRRAKRNETVSNMANKFRLNKDDVKIILSELIKMKKLRRNQKNLFF